MRQQIAAGKHQAALDDHTQNLTEARERWVEVSGRVAQHHAAWGAPVGATFVGLMPTSGDDDDGYRFTFYAANQAIHDLDLTVSVPRRVTERETPGLSL